jgi:hypothetical protein
MSAQLAGTAMVSGAHAQADAVTALLDPTCKLSSSSVRFAPQALDRVIYVPELHSEPDFSMTARLLTDGGDARIVCEGLGRNRYGCTPVPDREVIAYGSSTASTISTAGFAAANRLRNRLARAVGLEQPHLTYERELNRVRAELIELCGLEKLKGLNIIFGASGTDLHLFASQLMVDPREPRPVVVRVEASETGSGVPDALAGRHFSDCAAFGDSVTASVPLDCGRPVEICEVKCRTADGQFRTLAAIDAETEENVARAASAGHRVLLNLVDVSKTGLLAPSPDCVDRLRRRFPHLVEVLVDACQFRLATATLKSYLEHDFLVAITGSKFVTGPTFCGALLVPEGAARRLRSRKMPVALKSYSSSADWPRQWAARAVLSARPNFGLLLRWEAALTELRAFRQLSEAAISVFIEAFAKAISRHLADSTSFEMVPIPILDRGSIAPRRAWDQLPTIFPFLLRRTSSAADHTWLETGETKKVQQMLIGTGYQLGQPVPCGKRGELPVSALRLCLSSRLIVDALSQNGRGPEAVIAEAIGILDKAARLASLPAL